MKTVAVRLVSVLLVLQVAFFAYGEARRLREQQQQQPPRPCDEYYVADEGDTLQTISVKCNNIFILEDNPQINDSDDIGPGTVLYMRQPWSGWLIGFGIGGEFFFLCLSLKRWTWTETYMFFWMKSDWCSEYLIQMFVLSVWCILLLLVEICLSQFVFELLLIPFFFTFDSIRCKAQAICALILLILAAKFCVSDYRSYIINMIMKFEL